MSERRAPVLDAPRGTISWEEHVKAWEAYHRRHSEQSAETIARRGGFGISELADQLGHLPRTWQPDARGIERMTEYGVTPAPTRPSQDAAGDAGSET